jgi:hypothetical protein
MKAYGGVSVWIHLFLTLALVGCLWSASRPDRFAPGERVIGTLWTGRWVDPRAGGQHGEVKILDHTGTRTPTPRSSTQ